MPRREDIEAELAGAVVFTRLNANTGFHQIPLDEETKNLYLLNAFIIIIVILGEGDGEVKEARKHLLPVTGF